MSAQEMTGVVESSPSGLYFGGSSHETYKFGDPEKRETSEVTP